jgi:hypothetical protein
MPDAPSSLVKKLADILKSLERLDKNGKNQHFGYKYVTESDLKDAVRTKLGEKSLFITCTPDKAEILALQRVVPKTGEIVTTNVGILWVEFTIMDGESGEQIKLRAAGELDQEGGKSLYKALTGALKYFLINNFLISSGDDPEADHGHAQERAANPPPKRARGPEPATQEQLAEIETLARELKMDVRKDIYEPAKIANVPAVSTAKLIIERLKRKKEKTMEEAALVGEMDEKKEGNAADLKQEKGIEGESPKPSTFQTIVGNKTA